MDMDFAVSGPLVRRSRLVPGSYPSTRTFALRFLQTSPRGDTPFALLQVKFPVTGQKFPVPQNIFPVNLHRELREKSLQHSSFLLGNRFGEPQNRKIPCKIPC